MSASIICEEKTAAGSACGNPVMFRMSTGELVCRQHRRARQHRGKSFERHKGSEEHAAVEESTEPARKVRPRWRARGAIHHCFVGAGKMRWSSLCGEVVFSGKIGGHVFRPPIEMRCPACDEEEAARFGDGHSLPTTAEWREISRAT